MANFSEFDSAISRGQDGAASNDAGQLDSAGQAILKLLHKAADTAEANSRHRLGDGAKALKSTRSRERSNCAAGVEGSALSGDGGARRRVAPQNFYGD